MALRFRQSNQSSTPIQGLQGAIDPDRFNQLQNEFGSNPGSFTGPTGLLPNDLSGYADRMNRQREYLSMLKGLQGAGS